MEKHLIKISIGEPFNLFSNRVYSDSCIMEVMRNGAFMLCVFLKNMSNEEKKLLKCGKIKVKIIEGVNFIFPLMQFDNTDFIFEIDFNPMLYKDKRIKLSGKSNMVNIIGIELTDYTVQTIRMANMPKKLYNKYITNWNINNPKTFNEKYIGWTNSLRENYTVTELWDMASYAGMFGEK